MVKKVELDIRVMHNKILYYLNLCINTATRLLPIHSQYFVEIKSLKLNKMAVVFPSADTQTMSKVDIPMDQVVEHVIVCVKKSGRAIGELYEPNSIAVDPATNNIYIVEGSCSGNFARISIFSDSGEYLDNYHDEHMFSLWGIAIHENNVYVTDWVLNAVFHLKIEGHLRLVTRQGSKGSGVGKFDKPRQLSISSDGDVYIADRDNDRIQVLDGSLHPIKEVTHPSMHRPCDVKLSTNEMYVLSSEDSPCMHVFTHGGHKTRSLITRGVGMQVDWPLYFCIHPIFKNFIISEKDTNVQIFSNDGIHLQTLEHDGAPEHDWPRIRGYAHSHGLALTPNRKLVVFYRGNYCCLNIFSFL